MPGWVRTFWAAVILILPGGFLLFLGYAFGRALLRTRLALAQSHGGEAHFREILASVRLRDVLHEVRASI